MRGLIPTEDGRVPGWPRRSVSQAREAASQRLNTRRPVGRRAATIRVVYAEAAQDAWHGDRELARSFEDVGGDDLSD